MRILRVILIWMLLPTIMLACGGDSTEDNASGNNGTPVSDEPLTLEDGEYYVIRATGAVNETVRGTTWGGESRNRRLFDMGTWWTLRLGGTSPETIGLIHLDILKVIEPGTYDLNAGSVVNTPDADEPVKVVIIEAASQLLNDDEEFDGMLTIDAISDTGMSGSIDITLTTENGEVQVSAIFDVPLVEPIQS